MWRVADTDMRVEQFEANRAHLKQVAFRMLGSATEADDAVQEAWLRLSRADRDGIQNLGGWLTTAVARVPPRGNSPAGLDAGFTAPPTIPTRT